MVHDQAGATHPETDDAAGRELDCLVTIGAAAGKIAHEINNPLASVHNAFLLVKDAIPASHPYFRYVVAIEREIRRMAAVTQRFVDTYRPERDRAIGVAVSAIVSDAVHLVAQSHDLPADRFVLDNHVTGPFAAPAGLLRHALQHLLDAAVRQAGSAAAVHLQVSLDAAALTISISVPAAVLHGTPDVHYPARLVAALGGSLHGAEFAPTLFTVVLPAPAVGGEPG